MNNIDEQVRRLAKVRDEQLAGKASGAGARALLASIITDTEPQRADRIFVPRQRLSRQRRWLAIPFIAGTAVAGLAAALIIIPGTAPVGTSPYRRPAATAPEATGHLAARNFLLAAAESAAREPAEDSRGRYLYVRTLTVSSPDDAKSAESEKAYGDLWMKLSNEVSKKAFDLESEGREAEIKSLAEKFRQDMREYRKKNGLDDQQKPPYSVKRTWFDEKWSPRNLDGSIGRITYGIDPKVTFASPADEQKWKDLGSPDLGLPKKPKIQDMNMQTAAVGVCDPIDECGNLPTTKEEMAKWLRKDFAKRWGMQWGIKLSFSEYLSAGAMYLNQIPLSPGARAAFLQVLADQPEITSLGKVTDPLGRTGVVLALTYTSNDSIPDLFGRTVQSRFLFAEGSAKLLASDNSYLQIPVSPTLQPKKTISADEDWSDWEINANTGWVDKLGERPKG